jgi:heme exporter protein D
MSEFFHMGGYAFYVWSAYGITAVFLIGFVVWTLVSLKLAERELSVLEAIAPRRRQRINASENSNAEP